MKPEREKEIRARLAAFKHWTYLSDNPSGYLESHGPDMEELLEELDRVRGKYMECATTKDGFAISLERIDNENSETQMENVQLRAKLNVAVEALIKIDDEPNEIGLHAYTIEIEAWNIAHEALENIRGEK